MYLAMSRKRAEDVGTEQETESSEAGQGKVVRMSIGPVVQEFLLLEW